MLRDPHELAKELEGQTQTSLNLSLDETLAETHGAKIFKQYIANEKPTAKLPYVSHYT